MKGLMRTILFFSWMWFVLFISILLLIPLFFLKTVGAKKAAMSYTRRVTKAWATHLVWTSGSKVKVSGLENVPAEGGFCLLANHSSNFDIPLLLSRIPRLLGFVGKSEMKKIPFLSTWMKALNSVFLDRNNLSDSMRGLMQARDNILNGIPMVLFPEGTRTKTGKPGTFHPAGIRLMAKKGIKLLPVTIAGSRDMFEKQKRITPVAIEISIHPAIDSKSADDSVEAVKKSILSGLF